MRVLVYGYGNPGRQDDGLGNEVVELIDKLNIPGVVTDSNYQLNIEDAVAVSESDAVVFVDAALDLDAQFDFIEIFPSAEIAFTTHAMSPQSVLAVCEETTGKTPKAFLLGIRGYEWELAEGLSSGARANLDAAFEFLSGVLRQGSIQALEQAAITFSERSASDGCCAQTT